MVMLQGNSLVLGETRTPLQHSVALSNTNNLHFSGFDAAHEVTTDGQTELL